MKKILLIVLCTVYTIAHAAESDKTIMCLVRNTLFLVSKDNICSYQEILDAMVVGRKEQNELKKVVSEESTDNVIGTAFCVQDKKIYILPKTSQSSSQDDSYKPFTRDYNLYKKAKIEEVQCDLMHVIEPIIVLKPYEKHASQVYSYSPYRSGTENPYSITCHNFLGDTALEQASKDLGLCYQNALMKGLELLKNKKSKSIGFNDLGRWIPKHMEIPATFQVITDFLDSNDGYLFVHLFVRKHSELKMYKALMAEYNEKYKK